MFGFGDFGVTLAFLVTVGSTALCVFWGWKYWNRDDEPMPEPVHPADEPDIDNEV
jgi:hypothetical protein